MGGALLTAIVGKSGYWRVKIAWPKHHPEREVPDFGHFNSKAEADHWIQDIIGIQEHHWMTKQSLETEFPPEP
jgi:hypothetical protein